VSCTQESGRFQGIAEALKVAIRSSAVLFFFNQCDNSPVRGIAHGKWPAVPSIG
jgi:hypothetical protein